MWSTASQEVNVLFTPPSPVQKTGQKEELKPPIPKPEDTHNSKKSRSELVIVNTTSDISPKQVQQLRAVLAKHEDLFADKLGMAKEPEEDWLRIPLYPGAEREITSQRPYCLSPKE
jgi:hypothetical protein